MIGILGGTKHVIADAALRSFIGTDIVGFGIAKMGEVCRCHWTVQFIGTVLAVLDAIAKIGCWTANAIAAVFESLLAFEIGFLAVELIGLIRTIEIAIANKLLIDATAATCTFEFIVLARHIMK